MTVASSQFLRACRLQPVDYTPVWFMRQSGRYLPQYRKLRKKFDVLTISKTPELATKAALIPVKVLGVDAAIIFADLMSPVEAMGIDFKIVDGTGPVIENPIRNMADIARLKQVDPKKDLDFVLTAIKQIKKELKDKVPLIGFSGAPFTLACYLVEGVASRNFEKTKALMFSDIQAWSQLLSKLTKVVISYLLAQIEAGCTAVQVFDSWAGVLSAADYQKYVAPYSKQVFDKV